jgi:hypothetical protein
MIHLRKRTTMSVIARGLGAAVGMVALVGALTAVGVAAGASTNEGVYVPVTANRILDTRHNLGISGPLTPNVPKMLQVTNRAADPIKNVPAEATAVVGNLTVTGSTAAGYVGVTKVAMTIPDLRRQLAADVPGPR